MYLPTAIEQLAIQARLNFMLGPREYDKLFIDFACGEIRGTSVQDVIDQGAIRPSF